MPAVISPLKETPVILHQGVFKKTASVAEAVFVITGMTIGAGILGLPYAASRAGLAIGLLFIVILGFATLALNLMLGEISLRTSDPHQLPGFGARYLGVWAKHMLSFIMLLSGFGVLLAYIVGQGESWAAIFGGTPGAWSVMFWSLGSIAVWRGLGTVKKLDKILGILVIGLLTGLSLYLLPKFQIANLFYTDTAKFFLPYGLVLFAFRSSPAIMEAHALLPGSQRHFKKAVMLGTLIPMVVYLLFTAAVAGGSGLQTAEIATVGLGREYGPAVLLIGNLFAIFAMGTAFMNLGVALKQSLVWDLKLPALAGQFLVIFVPITLFVAGLRRFIAILDVVGGLFMSIEALAIALIYWQAKKKGDGDASRYNLTHSRLLTVSVIAIFTFALIYYIVKMFIH